MPNTRGVEQSRTKEAVVEEMRVLAEAGYREVTLLGQNIDSWGRDMSPKQKFADLLKACGEVEGIDRVRYLTAHPRYMSKRVISTVASNPKLMPCFNVPFQSGNSDNVTILVYKQSNQTNKMTFKGKKCINDILPGR